MGLAALKAWTSPALGRAVVDFGAADLWQAVLSEGQATTLGRRAAGIDVAALVAATAGCGSRFVIPSDDEWPSALDDLAVAEVQGMGGTPPGLWVRGDGLPEAHCPVAIVGARACTSYGEQVAVEFASDLASAGHAIVSGLAFGIDAAAHRGALGGRGRTLAVLASGLDEPYPSGNAGLAEAIARSGTLVSEMPPGARPTRHAFLARNRIIAALSEVVVVVEAAARSGARNTTTWAGTLGRPVAAVPGPVTSSLSETPHRLIRDSEAVLVSSASQVRQLAGALSGADEWSPRGDPRAIDRLPADLRELREAIGSGESITCAALSARTGQRIIDVLDRAQQLADLGWLVVAEDGSYRLPGRPIG